MLRAVAGLTVAAALLAGCDARGGSPSTATVTGHPIPSPAGSRPSSSAVPRPAASAAPAHGFSGTTVPATGTVGNLRYRVDLPQLRGGAPAPRDRFNAGMRAALDDLLRLRDPDGRAATMEPGGLSGGFASAVTFLGAGAVAGVLVVSTYTSGTPHPNTLLATTVIDTATARPVLLGELFTDERAGYAALAAAVGDGLKRAPFSAGRGPAADARALANWLPTATGITVFVEVPHAVGDYYPVAVPWSALTPVLAPRTPARFAA